MKGIKIKANQVKEYRSKGLRVVKSKKGEYYAYQKLNSKRYVNPVQKLTTKKGTKTKKADQILNKEFDNISKSEKKYIDRTLTEYRVNKKVITLGQVKAMFTGNRLSIFLANFQLSVDEILKGLKLNGEDVNEDWLLNQDHWTFLGDNDADIALPSGNIAYFTFNYIEHTYDIAVRLE